MSRTPAPSRPKVFLHIGEPKTGTTFLQQVMWRNRSELAARGVVLPGHHPQDHFRASQDLRGIAKLASDPAGSWTGEWDIVARQARQAPRVAVISHELFSAADPVEHHVADADRRLDPAGPLMTVTSLLSSRSSASKSRTRGMTPARSRGLPSFASSRGSSSRTAPAAGCARILHEYLMARGSVRVRAGVHGRCAHAACGRFTRGDLPFFPCRVCPVPRTIAGT